MLGRWSAHAYGVAMPLGCTPSITSLVPVKTDGRPLRAVDGVVAVVVGEQVARQRRVPTPTAVRSMPLPLNQELVLAGPDDAEMDVGAAVDDGVFDCAGLCDPRR